MAIDPKILARMKPPQDDGQDLDDLPGMPAPVPQRGRSLGLPDLTGTPKQVKWALTIRENALALDWPPSINQKLWSIVDSSWWIANKAIVSTMKFKEPSPNQLVGPEAALFAVVNSKEAHEAFMALEDKMEANQTRLNDAAAWAASVSRHPKLAEAAILAVLSRLYKGDMRHDLQAKAHQIIREANFEIGRDLDAITKMLSS